MGGRRSFVVATTAISLFLILVGGSPANAASFSGGGSGGSSGYGTPFCQRFGNPAYGGGGIWGPFWWPGC